MAIEPQPVHDGAKRKQAVVLAAVAVVALLLVTVVILTAGTTARNPAQEVTRTFATHLQSIKSENLTAAAAGYEGNATVVFKGMAAGLIGEYNGITNIKVLYDVILSPNYFGTVNISNLTFAANVSGDQRHATVNSTFDMNGNSTMLSRLHGGSPVPGVYNARVSSSTSYVRDGETWIISNETWDFATFNLTT
jgi:hypothetical protein